MGSRELHVESATLGKFDYQNKKVSTKMRSFVAMILVAAATNAGILRHRIASDLPSRDDVAAAFAQMKDMKLSELANVLKNSEAVRNSYRRAAMDMQEHDGLSKMVKHLNMALDVLDSSADGSSDNVNQADAEDGDDEAEEEDAGEGDATTDDSETADDADADVDANADEEEEDENLNQADIEDDDDDDDIEDDDESFEFEEEEEEEDEDE